jgi:serine/threonine protein kinase/tetratricopeptide (TPR) repeat protein
MLMDTMTAPSVADLRVAVTAFEHAFEERGSADLEDFLPPAADPDYATVLGELVRADLRLNWAFGRRRYVDDYVRRFPTDPDQLAALAQEEYQARLAAGDDVQPDQYQSRYGVGVDGWLPPGPAATPVPDDLICLPRERTRTIAVPCARPAPARKAAAAGQMPRAGQRFLHFDLVKELGRGVFGRVFLARQTDLAERPVALKVTPETDGEPQLLARLQHTHIVPIHAVYQAGPLQAICMPYFGSVTLARVIADLGRSPGQLPQTGRGLLSTLFETRVDGSAPTRADEDSPLTPAAEEPPALTALAKMSQVGAALWIAARLADGLAHAHERGILHCDLKPANVLVSDDGQPMLLDFNVSADRAAVARRKTLRLGGTLPYMAPEYLNLIHNDTGELTPRADLFSLGGVLYELLTGTDPYPAVNDEAGDPVGSYLAAHGRLPDPPSRRNRAVTPAVDAIVLKLLEPDPARRYAEAAHVREDLERQLTDRPLKFAPDTSVRERARKWRRRNPRLTVGLAVALAALAFFILPATAFAVRSEQLAARRHEVARAEAVLAQQDAVRQLKTAQVLLSSRTLDPVLITEGFERGQAVLDDYGVGTDDAWAERSRVTLLSADRQAALRQELGGTLLMFARVELARKPGDKDAAAQALKWNRLAETCYPADARPKALATQRAALGKLLPGRTTPLPESAAAPVDAYYDGLDRLAAGKPNEALVQLVPFTDAHPDHFMAWYLRGICHEAVGQFPDAAAAFTVCTTLWPEFAWPHFSRGVVRLRQGRPADAEGDFTRALDRRPHWADAFLNRALAREARTNYKGAEADLTAALAEPNVPTRVYFLRARVRLAAGDKAGAAADAAAGKKQEPRDVTSWIARAFWRLKADDPKGAVADYDAALEKNPRSPDALRSKAAVLADNLNRPKEAVAALDKLLEMYPTYTEARAGRAVYLARTGDARRATADLAVVLAEEPTPYRLYQMAGVYAQLAKGDATGANKQKALQLMAKAFRTGFEQYDKVAHDPDLSPVRDDPDFKALVEHAKKLQVK